MLKSTIVCRTEVNRVTNENTYTIEQIKVSPININTEDHESIKHTISKLADGPLKGETEIEVFKIFASAFRTEIWRRNFYLQSAFNGLQALENTSSERWQF